MSTRRTIVAAPVEPHPTAFVFANAIGGAVDRGNWARREWLPALKTAGYEKKFHVHELRHFAATALDEQGMVGKLRTEIVGHANEQITNSIYTHVGASVSPPLQPSTTRSGGRRAAKAWCETLRC
jgi:integrase